MNEFITWDVLMTYASFVTIVYMVVEFTKDLKFIKKIKTSFLIAFILLTIVNAVTGTFKLVDLVLYALSSMTISLGANGLSNFNKEGVK